MECKKCGESFSKTDGHDVWELRKQYVQPDQGGQGAHVHFEDAGVFCSRNCLKDYLAAGNKSGIFNLKKQGV